METYASKAEAMRAAGLEGFIGTATDWRSLGFSPKEKTECVCRYTYTDKQTNESRETGLYSFTQVEADMPSEKRQLKEELAAVKRQLAELDAMRAKIAELEAAKAPASIGGVPVKPGVVVNRSNGTSALRTRP